MNLSEYRSTISWLRSYLQDKLTLVYDSFYLDNCFNSYKTTLIYRVDSTDYTYYFKIDIDTFYINVNKQPQIYTFIIKNSLGEFEVKDKQSFISWIKEIFQ